MLLTPIVAINQSQPSLPRVCIIMINSRGMTHPELVKRAKDSIKMQTWANTEFIEVRNLDRASTIGACRNAAVAATNASLVMFVDDDDMIAPELTMFLVDLYHRSKHVNKSVVGATCFMTAQQYDHNKREMVGQKLLMPSSFVGMYERKLFDRLLFKPHLKKHSDVDFLKRVRERKMYQAACSYYYGYFYTLHPDMVSGFDRFDLPPVSPPTNLSAVK